ncbi:hypothetical protein JW766_04750 [Candidatus Dojkabacteria bacterium]|nr:hypothetical protein [Candidatus Dojkabacteria bacterium]
MENNNLEIPNAATAERQTIMGRTYSIGRALLGGTEFCYMLPIEKVQDLHLITQAMFWPTDGPSGPEHSFLEIGLQRLDFALNVSSPDAGFVTVLVTLEDHAILMERFPRVEAMYIEKPVEQLLSDLPERLRQCQFPFLETIYYKSIYGIRAIDVPFEVERTLAQKRFLLGNALISVAGSILLYEGLAEQGECLAVLASVLSIIAGNIVRGIYKRGDVRLTWGLNSHNAKARRMIGMDIREGDSRELTLKEWEVLQQRDPNDLPTIRVNGYGQLFFYTGPKERQKVETLSELIRLSRGVVERK